MDERINSDDPDGLDAEYKKFAWFRITAALVLAAGILWAVTLIMGSLELTGQASASLNVQAEPEHAAAVEHQNFPEQEAPGVHETGQAEPPAEEKTSENPSSGTEKSHSEKGSGDARKDDAPHRHEDSGGGTQGSQHTTGTHFVDSLIEPIDHEVNGRFWGWRPNDIINVTDNVNEMQLGVLEVTRRTTVALTEKISRTGSASALNPHLENAMNAFMIKADSYWMPAAETKYNEAIDELKKYREQLLRGEVHFYTRSDSLIPLLQSLEELLGSCDENLVKLREENGEKMSTFRADNYFYYAKGVAGAMSTILHAADEEFSRLLEVRNARDIMHHAMESCHHAAEIKPWIMVTEASLNGILANHRANMAAHISHARYYLGILVKTLST